MNGLSHEISLHLIRTTETEVIFVFSWSVCELNGSNKSFISAFFECTLTHKVLKTVPTHQHDRNGCIVELRSEMEWCHSILTMDVHLAARTLQEQLKMMRISGLCKDKTVSAFMINK